MSKKNKAKKLAQKRAKKLAKKKAKLAKKKAKLAKKKAKLAKLAQKKEKETKMKKAQKQQAEQQQQQQNQKESEAVKEQKNQAQNSTQTSQSNQKEEKVNRFDEIPKEILEQFMQIVEKLQQYGIGGEGLPKLIDHIKQKEEEMKPKFINCTPHSLDIYNENGQTKLMTLQPSGVVPRVSTTTTKESEIEGIPIFKTQMGDIVNLPDPQPNTFLIVSTLVANHPSLVSRNDILCPGDLLRDPSGKPIGCKGLKRI